MKIHYTCEHCGEAIDVIEVDKIYEVRFGFDILTAEERSQLITVDPLMNAMYVQSLCDACIESLGVADEGFQALVPATPVLH